MNFNRAIVLGNLTRDPESRALPSGLTVTKFSIATNRVYTDKSGAKQQAVEFHNIVAFGKLAEICSRYLNKGKMVLIEGRIQTSSWQGQDGVKRYRAEIIAENMQLGPRGGASEGGSAPSSPVSQPGGGMAAEEIPVIETDENMNFEEENEGAGGVNVKEIPF